MTVSGSEAAADRPDADALREEWPGPSPDSRALVSSAGQYALVELAQQCLGLLALPLVVAFLPAPVFGLVTWALVVSQVAFTVAALGFDFTIVRMWNQWGADRPAVLSTLLVICVGWSAVLVAVSQALPLGLEGRHDLARLGVYLGITLAIRSIALSILRMQGLLKRYGAVMVGGSALQVAAQVVLVTRGYGATGFVLGSILGMAASMALGYGFVARAFAAPRRGSLTRGTLGFVLRTWPASVVNRAGLLVDRFALGAQGAVGGLGLYGLVSRFTVPLRLLSGGFKLALSPALSHHERDGAVPGLVAAFGRPVIAAIVLAALLVSLATGVLAWTPWRSVAADAQRLVALLVLADVLAAISVLGQLALYYSSKPHHGSFVSVATTATLAGASLLLVPRFGAFGAAGAQLAASCVGLLGVTAFAPGMAGTWLRFGIMVIPLAVTGILAFIAPAGALAIATGAIAVGYALAIYRALHAAGIPAWRADGFAFKW